MSRRSTLLVLAAATLAGAAGLGLSLYLNGPASLAGSRVGQRVLEALPTAAPPGVAIAGRGDPLPDLQLPDLDGRPRALSDWRGRPLLINVWATWCAPCIHELPMLDAFSRQRQTRDETAAIGVQVVGIALDDVTAVRAFLARTPIRYTTLIDIAGPADSSVRLGNAHGVLPYSVLVDADGRIVRTKLGPFAEGELDEWTARPD